MSEVATAFDAQGRIIGTFRKPPKAQRSYEPQFSVGECPLCNEPMTISGARRKSQDHILKRSHGYRKLVYGDTRNTRIVCQPCNGLLSVFGQCPAAVVCMLALPAPQQIAAGKKKREKLRWYDATPRPKLGDVWVQWP